MLKKRIKALEDVDEALRSLYKKDGDGYVLDMEQEEGDDSGDEEPGRVKEFRDKNITLLKEKKRLEEALKQFEGLDPDVVKTLRQQAEEAKEKEIQDLLKKGKVDDVVQRKLAAREAEFKKQIDAVNSQMGEKDKTIGSLRGQLQGLLVDSGVTKAIEAAGLKPRVGAMEDIMTRARSVWKINDDGQMVALDAKGEPRYSSTKAGDPLTLKEYVTKDLLESAGHLFEAATGGGAAGGKGGGTSTGPVISGSDPLEMGRRVKDIASGKARVQINEGL